MPATWTATVNHPLPCTSPGAASTDDMVVGMAEPVTSVQAAAQQAGQFRNVDTSEGEPITG